MLVGAFVALAFPPFGLWPLAFVAFVLFSLPLLKPEIPNARSSGWYFASYTFFINIFGFYWLAYTLAEFGDMPWIASIPLTVVIFVFFSLFSWIVGWAWSHVASRVPFVARALLLFAWLVTWDAIDLRLFPWTPAMAVGSDPLLLASVNVFQTWGWRVIFFAFAVFSAWSWNRFASRPRFRWLPIGAASLLILITSYAVGFHARARLKAEYPDRQPVALIQGNVGNYEKKLVKLNVEPTVRNVIEIHRKLIRQAAERFQDIQPGQPEPWIFWPETAYPGTPLQDARFDDLLRVWTREAKGLQVVGTYESAMTKFGDGEQVLDFNIVALYHEKTGYVAHYRKMIRIPFGEYIPGDQWFPHVYQLLPAVNHFGKGEHFTGLPHPDPNGPVFMPLVCYEILSNSFRRNFEAELKARYPGRPIVVVNPSNDSWYGSTSEPYQNSLLARWAIASLGLPGLRPTNTGFSQVIAPWGEVMAQDGRDEMKVIFGELPVRKVTPRMAP
jgi:apolipoprotein N-acyltransferase